MYFFFQIVIISTIFFIRINTSLKQDLCFPSYKNSYIIVLIDATGNAMFG